MTSADKRDDTDVDTSSKDDLFFPFNASRDFHLTSGGHDAATSAALTSGVVGGGGSKYKQYACPNCKYVTDRKNNLKRHLLTMHEKCAKLLECCDAIFPNKSALRQHVTERHAGAGYGCGVCGRRFSRKALMKRHSAVHSGQREHSCTLCDYATSHKSNLDRHVRRHQQRPQAIGPDDSDVLLGSSSTSGSREDKSRVRDAALFRPTSISSSASSSASQVGLLRRHGYATDGGMPFPYGTLPPLVGDYSLLRQRAMLKFFNFPSLAVGWSSFLGSLASSRRHGYADNWDEMVAMVTNNYAKDSGRLFHPILHAYDRPTEEWPLNLKFSKNSGYNFLHHQPETTTDHSTDGVQDRKSPALGLPSWVDEPRDLSVSSGSDRRNNQSPCLGVVETVRRTRLVPNLHTCSECSLTFASQLELRNHAESSHPVEPTGSHLKSITLQVREAQRFAEQTSGLM